MSLYPFPPSQPVPASSPATPAAASSERCAATAGWTASMAATRGTAVSVALARRAGWGGGVALGLFGVPRRSAGALQISSPCWPWGSSWGPFPAQEPWVPAQAALSQGDHPALPVPPSWDWAFLRGPQGCCGLAERGGAEGGSAPEAGRCCRACLESPCDTRELCVCHTSLAVDQQSSRG